MAIVTKRKPELTREEWEAQLEASRSKPHIVPEKKVSLAEKVSRLPLHSPDAMDTAINLVEKLGAKEAGEFLTRGIKKVTEEKAAVAESENYLDYFKSVGQLPDGGVRFLIEGLFPEGTTFVGALPGAGKTWFGLSIAKALVTGKKFLGRFNVPEALPVLYMIPETSSRAFKRRLVQMEIPDDPKRFLCRTISEGKTLMLDHPALLNAVREMKPVVFLDTAIRFSTANDENSASQNKKLVDDIRELIVAGAVGVFAFHHATKSSAGQALTQANSLRGTGDYAAMAESAYGLAVDQALYNDGDGPLEILVVCTKPRDISPAPKPFTLISTMKDETGKMVDVLAEYHDFLIKDESEVMTNTKDALFRILIKNPEMIVEDITKELNRINQTNFTKSSINRHMVSDGWSKTGPAGPNGKKTWKCGTISVLELASKSEADQGTAINDLNAQLEVPF
jgi:hypothetical protein